MLILSRKDGESINIGDDICVKIIDISKGVVKLGLEAPEDVMILRSELKKAVESANIESNKEADLSVLTSISDKLL